VRFCGEDLTALSENSVVGCEIERFFAWQSLSRAEPRELKQAILVLSSMQLPASRDRQAENKPLEARPSFQTEPGLSTKISKKIVALGRASWYIVHQSTFAGLGISRFFLSLRFSALLPLFSSHPVNG